MKVTKGEIGRRMNGVPYLKAIEQLRKISKEFTTPVQKLKCLDMVSRAMADSVSDFWEGVPVK